MVGSSDCIYITWIFIEWYNAGHCLCSILTPEPVHDHATRTQSFAASGWLVILQGNIWYDTARLWHVTGHMIMYWFGVRILHLPWSALCWFTMRVYSRVNFIISYSHMWWHFIDQLFWGQTANLIQPFLLVNEVGGSRDGSIPDFCWYDKMPIHSQSITNIQLGQKFSCWSYVSRLTFDQHVTKFWPTC